MSTVYFFLHSNIFFKRFWQVFNKFFVVDLPITHMAYSLDLKNTQSYWI